jgi:hypothetical protein
MRKQFHSFQTAFIILILFSCVSTKSNYAQVISSFTPASGPVGTLVTITGTGLNNPTAFTIGGRTAIIVSNTGSVLVGLVMPGSVTGAVSVSTVSGAATGTSNFTVTPTPYPSLQQGDKLIGNDSLGAALQGCSVAVSADGNTAIVGGYQDNGGQGAAWVYTRNGSTWSQQGSKLVGFSGSVNAAQGWSVALSADGNTAIVGAPYENAFQGAAWVYTRSGSTWSQQVRLVGTGSWFNDYQGISVALSSDGNTAIVGATGDNANQGAAWVYNRTGSTWSQQGSKLVGTGSSGNSYQGFSVALSADGNTAIVGGAYDNAFQGAAWVYSRSGSSWSQQGSKLVGYGSIGSQVMQGQSVALSADGNTAIVGGNGDNANLGAAWVYTRSGSTWSQQGSKLVGAGSSGNSNQGWSVALSADGNTAIVGGDWDNNLKGAAWVYTRSGNTWSQRGSKLVGTGSSGNPFQGSSVALSADGNTAIVGGFGDNTNHGASWVYVPCITPVAYSIIGGGGYCTGGAGVQVGLANSQTGVSYQLLVGGIYAGIAVTGTGAAISFGNQTATGTYTILASSGNCTATMTGSVTVTINPNPTSTTISADATTTFCQGGSVVLSGNNNSGIWNTGATTGSITVTSSGTYFITNTNSCGSVNSNSITVTVNQAPAASTVIAGGATTFCQGGSVVLSGNNNGGIWNTGATTSSITVTSSGSYFVTNTNNCGSIQSNSITVNVNPPLVASTITAGGATTFCQGGSVVLINNSNGGTWNTGATTGSITVTSSGTYFITNTNSCGSVNSNSITVTVNQVPAASTVIAGGATTFCQGGSVVLSGNNNGGTWSTGAITSSITVISSGTYFVTNTNNCGSTQSNSITVNVNPPLVASTITAGGATTFCQGGSVVLSGNSNGGTWSTGATNSSITVTSSGNYFVNNTNSCGSVSSNSITITVNQVPAASTIIAGNATTFCQGGSVVLSGNDNSGTWSTGATTSSITVTSSGTYFVTNTNNCGSTQSNIITVTVNTPPATSIITAGGPTTFCQGGSVVLSGSNNSGTWSTGATTNSINVNSSGIYFVTNTNNCGSTQSNSITVTVNTPPAASTITAGGATTFCQGGSVVLSGNNNSGTWSTGATTNSINVNSSGIYFVSNANNCGSVNSNSITVSENALPTVSFTGLSASYSVVASSITLIGSPAGGTFSGPGISGNTFSPSMAGIGGPHTITYTYTDVNSCTNSSSQQTSISNVKDIVVYPNPAISEVVMTLPVMLNQSSLTVIDIFGKLVLSRLNYSGNKIKLDVRNLANGNYIIRIIDKDHCYIGKFMKG